MQDTGENGIAGVTVKLYDCASNALLDTTSTDVNGNYQFSGLMPGVYHVEFVAPSGYVYSAQDVTAEALGTDSDANGAGITACYTVNSGDSIDTVDAGLYQKASLGDYVWVDANNDGQQNDGVASGLNGVTVNLKDGNGNTLATTTTANDVNGNPGYYLFSDLIPGDYQVEFIKPAGYAFAQRDQGADGSDSDADTSTGKTIVTTLTSGENDLSWDAGLVKLASLGDRVWEDSNGNGKQDDGEPGIGGVKVTLVNCATNAIVATTTTADGTGADPIGWYNFAGIPPGTYHVVFETPTGYVQTTANVGDDTRDNDAVNGVTGCYTLNSGDTNTTVDAGFYKTASLGDRLWVDTNGDGVQNDGATGISGQTITLIGGGADGLIATAGDNTTATTTTGADGYYQFAGLIPGVEYQVQFSKPAGTVFTGQDLGGNDMLDSDVDATGLSQIVTLTSGEHNPTLDAGIYAPNIGIDIEKYVRGEYTNGSNVGGEGLTPGYWKNHTSGKKGQPSEWEKTGFSPSDSYESVFGVDVPGSPTLLDALKAKGGDINALMRHSTAALLNASHGYVDYLYSAAEVIAMTQAAIASANYEPTKDLFDAQNNMGADLTTPATTTTTVVTDWFDADTPTGPYIPVGGEAQFKYEITNTGDVALSNIVVTDDRIASLTFVGGDTDNDGMLDVGEIWIYTASETVTTPGLHTNIGTATGVNAVTGTRVTDTDAANYTTSELIASIGDRVWLDANANGIQDLGEAGIEGVTVNLLDSVGALIASTLTDTDGEYLFEDLTPGDYMVEVVTPAGYHVTAKDAGGNDAKDSDIDALTGRTIVTTLSGGEYDMTWDAGLYQKASIGDRVWLDCDGDGIQDANEVGLGGVTVKLLNGAGSVVGSTTTDFQGNYLFSDLTPGDYAIQVVAPSGYGITARDQGGNDALDSDIDPTTGKTIVTTLTSGENDMSWDAGLTTTGVCVDLDLTSNSNVGSGAGNIRTISQNGLVAHASAFSRTDSGGVWASAYLGSYSGGLGVTDTGEDGGSPSHAVDNVGGRDNYVLFEFNQIVSLDKAYLGWVSGDSDIQIWIGNANDPFNNHLNLSDALLNGMFTEVNTTTSGSARWADVNAGDYLGNVIIIAADTTDMTPEDYFKIQTLSVCTPACGLTASIGDKVWLDSNGNGVQDSGEAGVGGVSVKLLNASGAVLATTTTDGNGNYLFSDLTPGDYAVQVVAPSGYTLTAKDQGGNDATDSDFDPTTGKTIVTTLTGGENDMSWDAGLKQIVTKARLGDTVWEDMNYNGIQDAGEAGISGVKVYLRNTAGTILKTTYTDSQGKYGFDVDAGTYQVQVVKPSGYYVTKQNQGSNDGVDSDINSSGYTGLYTVSAGQQNLTVDAGLYKKASVGDKVWDDMNHNNLQDASEPGIAGIKVTLKTAAGTTVASTTTDSSGNYKFANLNPGDYYLVFDKTNVMHYNYGAWYNMSTWKWAVKDAGSNDAIDSDVTGDAKSTTNVTRTSTFNLSSGENDMSWDAGITPIAIDLNGDGIQTVSRANSTGGFDLLGNGKSIQSGWLSGEDGFLAVDRNGNGRIDDINELFGGNNKGDGYAKLAAFDSNGDGVVDANDAAFADLRVWKDANGNHQTDAGELLTLDEAGVASLSLAYQAVPLMDGNGNLHLERGSATLADGTEVDMTDIYFGISAADVADAGIELPSLADLLSDGGSLDGLVGGGVADAGAGRVRRQRCLWRQRPGGNEAVGRSDRPAGGLCLMAAAPGSDFRRRDRKRNGAARPHFFLSRSHAPAWEQVPTLQRRVRLDAGASKTCSHAGAWEPDGWW